MIMLLLMMMPANTTQSNHSHVMCLMRCLDSVFVPDKILPLSRWKSVFSTEMHLLSDSSISGWSAASEILSRGRVDSFDFFPSANRSSSPWMNKISALLTYHSAFPASNLPGETANCSAQTWEGRWFIFIKVQCVLSNNAVPHDNNCEENPDVSVKIYLSNSTDKLNSCCIFLPIKHSLTRQAASFYVFTIDRHQGVPLVTPIKTNIIYWPALRELVFQR